MEGWKYNDEALKSFSGGNEAALRDRQYLKEKLRSTSTFIEANKKGLTKEEKAWLVILKTGNRHLERRLYPNRFVRYTRRAFIASQKALTVRRKKPLSDTFPSDRVRQTDRRNPVIKADTGKKVSPAARPTIVRIPAQNKYEAVKSIKQSKGRSL